jgi:hypothetical protein
MQKIPEKKLRRAREALARMQAGYAPAAPTDAALFDEEYHRAMKALDGEALREGVSGTARLVPVGRSSG